MKPAPFDYVRADSVEHAVTQLAVANDDGEGKIIAGGQSLMPLLALRLAAQRAHRHQPCPGPGRHQPAARRRPAVRRPHPAPLAGPGAAAGAVALVAGPGRQRRIPAADLFTGALQTSLDDDELIEAVEFPALGRWGFAEFARRHGDFGLVIAAVAEVEGHLRLALGGVAATPVRPAAAEAVLAGGPLDTARISEAAEAAAGEIEPASDVHATAGYRRQLTRVMVTRALTQAVAGRTQEEEPCA